MSRIVVQAPASTANLGAGFDCLSLALSLHNQLEVEPGGSSWVIEIEGEGAETLPHDPSHLTLQAMEQVFRAAGERPPGLRLKAINRIPLGSGLGSSSAALISGLAAANALAGSSLPAERLLEIAHRMEGHADNAAACLYGGLNLISSGDQILSRKVSHLPLRVAVAVPAIALPTAEMRAALPEQVSLQDAVFNIGRALLTVEALREGDLELLSRVMADRLHQSLRSRHIPGYEAAVAAAMAAGAAGVALSGAGPGVVVFSQNRHAQIVAAMAAAFEVNGVACQTYILDAESSGVKVSLEA